jgi:glycosyltransferase involved in cell wall biosynthesis
MRVAFTMGGIPSLGHSGSTLASWSILTDVLAAGHDVTAVLLPEASLVDGTVPERIEQLERLGVAVRLVEVPAVPPRGRWRARVDYARALAAPTAADLFPAARAADAVAAAVVDADAGVAFGIEAIAATAGLAKPFLALLSHPPAVSRRVRQRYDPAAAASVAARSFLAHADRRTAALLRRFASVGVFSRRYADWARARGARAWYAHFPIPDLAGPDWRSRRAAGKPNARPRLLMIGHLRGIGTISGLHLFVPEILPRLADALGDHGFEVHLVGGNDPPDLFRQGLDHPAVRLRGQLLEPEDEFFRADVLLAPNPTVTGASARILSGLSFGCCIVAHSDSVVGIPELAHDENCLLASDGPATVEEVLRALGDASMRDRLGDAARALYEDCFAPAVAARRITAEVERLAQTRR